MANNSDKIDSLKQTLSLATKRKLQKQIELLKLQNMERQYSEELTCIEAEVEVTSEKLKELKNQLTAIRHQISLVEICASSEKLKTQNHLNDLTNRKTNFNEIFERARYTAELRKKELIQNEEEEQELQRQKDKENIKKIEQLGKETVAVEKECEAVERECAVLKKRNAAIMLKMRRKLIETENIRKGLLKKKDIS